MHAATRPAVSRAAVALKPARAGVAQSTHGAFASAEGMGKWYHRAVGARCRARSAVTRGVAPGRDEAYYVWIDEQGIHAPSIGIGYVGVGVADANETYRGCVATGAINTGDVLVRCPAALAFCVTPSSPNQAPTFVSDECWRSPFGFLDGDDEESEESETQETQYLSGKETEHSTKTSSKSSPNDLNARAAQEFRLALVLLHEKTLGAESKWAPYLAHLPVKYDLLSSWSDAQLEELRDDDLRAAAVAQRLENERAFEAVTKCPPNFPCSALSFDEVAWGLDTVRSRSFLGNSVDTKTGDAKQPSEEPSEEPSKPSDGNKDDPKTKTPTETQTLSTVLLPLLDAFNHASHAMGGATKLTRDAYHDAFVLKAQHPLALGDEATISYGPLTNAELLLRFGFCVFGNVHEHVFLPGCADELEWLMPGSAREADLWATDGLQRAVTGARLDYEGKANANLLWALRVLLASDEEYHANSGAKGFRVPVRNGLDGKDVRGSGAQLAAEASLSLACARAFDSLGGGLSLAEDETQLEAAYAVLREVQVECSSCFVEEEFVGQYEGAGGEGDESFQNDQHDASFGDQVSCDDVSFDRCADHGDEGDDLNYLRRLVTALEFRVGRKRILAAAMKRYSPLKEALVKSGASLYAPGWEGGDYDEKVG